ncbi:MULTISPECIES: formate dehydrogenase subunit delta [Pseudomonas]|uniref:Formate dehydrogenase subunit delta n=1 Tax=Pseudomonas putida TaxID=303 RepID=A0A1L7NAE7_PSEPU|nr:MULTISPECIES: formate dehydrogenase subunit delta [Pseudomonas]MBP2084291.1 formate dehydrogenase subunit delta [Pseudomonas sp. PvP089]MBP2090007.1 formate dehydrogenase subunit delta [Pseudomonas sp. PvP088]MBP2223829.1 formate dehydrogenase subunit delta [Pseudomonas putida]MDO1497064.1 formate dehydrogenase subunit delta [Pseudomonas putida]PMY79911.1 formate dehydrogenase [Pseudomonas sp. FW306-2-2C-D06B]
MSSDNLVKMANQIAHYFDSEPDQALAVQGVRQHMQSFWTPAMRRQLAQWIEANAGEGLDPKVLEAMP